MSSCKMSVDNDEAIGPNRFSPIGDIAGLIEQLGESITAEACRQHTQ